MYKKISDCFDFFHFFKYYLDSDIQKLVGQGDSNQKHPRPWGGAFGEGCGGRSRPRTRGLSGRSLPNTLFFFNFGGNNFFYSDFDEFFFFDAFQKIL